MGQGGWLGAWRARAGFRPVRRTRGTSGRKASVTALSVHSIRGVRDCTETAPSALEARPPPYPAAVDVREASNSAICSSVTARASSPSRTRRYHSAVAPTPRSSGQRSIQPSRSAASVGSSASRAASVRPVAGRSGPRRRTSAPSAAAKRSTSQPTGRCGALERRREVPGGREIGGAREPLREQQVAAERVQDVLPGAHRARVADDERAPGLRSPARRRGGCGPRPSRRRR